MVFNFKKLLGKEESDEYVEIDLAAAEQHSENKVAVKPFVLKDFDDVNEVLNFLREGYTIAIIDIKPLRQKDVIELKRAVAKIKKTVDALEGSIAGFGENTLIATPQFAEIHKASTPKKERADFINEKY